MARESLSCLFSAIAGALLGIMLLSSGLKIGSEIPLWLTFPFIALLASVAITPLIHPRWWHAHYPKVSLFLGGLVSSIYSTAHENGTSKLLHAALEYVSFLSLVGGLFLVASCIQLDIGGSIRPFFNTLFLAVGALISNVLGTTGASMLLIRPFIKLNKNRIEPLHILFFIMIISNCGGALTPIGDPPLYLGYLKGIPFNWTLVHIWPYWLFVLALLLISFYFYDRFIAKLNKIKPQSNSKFGLKIKGKLGIMSLALMILAVFIDPLILKIFGSNNFPFSAVIQILIAGFCFSRTPSEIKQFNEFTIEPFKEVALLFAGIFITMLPALEYLALHSSSFGLSDAKSFYFGTGILSAFLDNAPTYLNFLQIAVGPHEITPENLRNLIEDPKSNHLLIAISCGAVFFGALTYIGNGPNFMVRSISENMGIKTYSFFGYAIRAFCILGPILIATSYLL